MRAALRAPALLGAALLGLAACSDSGAPAAATDLGLAAPQTAPATSSFADTRIIESSGIQRSLRLDGLFWVHNDSGGDATLYASDAAGQALGRIRLAGVEPTDWEDIAAFRRDGRAWLAVGDIGDNFSTRRELQLQVLPEPELETLGRGFDVATQDFRTLRLSYADGLGHDCESMAIDATSDEILIVTKELFLSGRQSLWTAKLGEALASGAAVLQQQTVIAGLDEAGGMPADHATTGMDLHPDRSEIAILTYGRVHRWRRGAGESWATAVARGSFDTPRVPAAGNSQAEGISYAADGRHLLVVAEHPSAPPSTISVLPIAAPD